MSATVPGIATSWRLLADTALTWPLSTGVVDARPVAPPIRPTVIAWHLCDDAVRAWPVCSGESSIFDAATYDPGPSEPGVRAAWPIGTVLSWPIQDESDAPPPEPPPPIDVARPEDPFGADTGAIFMALQPDGTWDVVRHASGSGLALDPTLATLVSCSLFCDALVDADEADRAGAASRGGYWADAYTGDAWGSKLWILARAKPTRATAQACEAAARDALDWMIAAGIAESVEASAVIVSGVYGAALELTIRIRRPAHLVAKFQEIWEATYAL